MKERAMCWLYLKQFLVLLVVTPLVSLGQRNPRIHNGEVVKLWDGRKLSGAVLDERNAATRMVMSNGDTISIPQDQIRRHYGSDFIDLYKKRKFHYKRANLFEYSMGFGGDHFHTDFLVGKRINARFDYGVGAGFHFNSYWFQLEGSWQSVDVTSIPIFAQAKFQLTRGARRVYVRGRAGYAFNMNTWASPDSRDGIYLNGSLGLMFPSKRRFKHYIEAGQYSLHATGVARGWGDVVLSDIEYNLWFNTFHVTWGVEFGTRAKRLPPKD